MAAINIQFTQMEIKIVKFIFRHYKDKYNPRQLAKLLSINHSHANKLCSLLADKKLLTKEQIGKYLSANSPRRYSLFSDCGALQSSMRGNLVYCFLTGE